MLLISVPLSNLLDASVLKSNNFAPLLIVTGSKYDSTNWNDSEFFNDTIFNNKLDIFYCNMKNILAILLFICNLCYSQNNNLPFQDNEKCTYDINYGFQI